MRKNKLNYIIISMASFLSACVSPPILAPAGKYNAEEQIVTLDRDWSDYSPLQGVYIPKSKVRFLTIDGASLNRLYISEGLSMADPLFVGPNGDRKSNPAPRGSENMSLSEQIEYVAKSIVELGYTKIETKSPKPVKISGQSGVRFELSMKTKEGLNISGLAQAVTKDKKNYYIIYLAPSQNYYAKYLSNVTNIMDSALLP